MVVAAAARHLLQPPLPFMPKIDCLAPTKQAAAARSGVRQMAIFCHYFYYRRPADPLSFYFCLLVRGLVGHTNVCAEKKRGNSKDSFSIDDFMSLFSASKITKILDSSAKFLYSQYTTVMATKQRVVLSLSKGSKKATISNIK